MITSIPKDFNLSSKFPYSVKKELENMTSEIPDSVIKNRLDLRNRLVFTIDPHDAKDFDDAVSLEELPNTNFLLGVHIADVSSFVPPDSAVDCEALKRGTSIYLVNRVIPMLPKQLSNNLCSLKPGEDRLTYSVLIELKPEGILENYQIRESIIRSRYRLTYKETQNIISGIENEQNRSYIDSQSSIPDLSVENKELKETLNKMVYLSRKLKKSWLKKGLIDFEAPEPEVIMDRKGRPVELKVKERLESHEIIENFMLLANRTVAEHINLLRQRTGKKMSFIYRIHERPRGEKLDDFIRFVRALGYNFNPGKKVKPREFQSLLNKVRGTSHEIIVEDIALRTMMKAVYSTGNVGHFGLAFRNYTHFTSPIRRYPDLVVHRLLKAYTKEKPEHPKLWARLSEICEIASDREITAQEAERESIKAKQLEFMKKRLGMEFNGIISGVTSFGIFVEIPEYLVEGLVNISDMNDDYYDYDKKNYCLIGKRKGKIYRLGDSVRIRVVRILKDINKLDFLLV